MDGFDLIPSLVPNLYDYRFQSLAALDDIRNSGMYQCVQYVAPASLASVVGLGTYTTNLIMKENTLIYGLFTYNNAAGEFTFKVYEEPGQPIISEYVRNSFGQDNWMLGSNPNTGVPVNRTGLHYQLLTQPAMVISGKIIAEISNPNITDIEPMVMLICAEPLSSLADISNRLCA
jgi:hypothetical protein